jgi:hypothetical protein
MVLNVESTAAHPIFMKILWRPTLLLFGSLGSLIEKKLINLFIYNSLESHFIFMPFFCLNLCMNGGFNQNEKSLAAHPKKNLGVHLRAANHRLRTLLQITTLKLIHKKKH